MGWYICVDVVTGVVAVGGLVVLFAAGLALLFFDIVAVAGAVLGVLTSLLPPSDVVEGPPTVVDDVGVVLDVVEDLGVEDYVQFSECSFGELSTFVT